MLRFLDNLVGQTWLCHGPCSLCVVSSGLVSQLLVVFYRDYYFEYSF